MVTPCGSGKSVIFDLGVNILRKKKGIENGIGICVEPLNNILSEKTFSNKNSSEAYLTMTGEDLKKGDAVLSAGVEDIVSGDVRVLYGHPESFLSPKGIFF